MNYQKVWMPEDLEYLRTHAGQFTDQQIADYLTQKKQHKITVHAVRKQRQDMGIKKKQGRGVCQVCSH